MEEAAVCQSSAQLSNLFAILVAVCGLNKPITLWENHEEEMTEEDFLHEGKTKKEKDMAVPVASSGIAATLLARDRTAYSAFKLPLDLTRSDSVNCNIFKGTGQRHIHKTCKIIVWDEATMSHRITFHAFENTLHDFRSSAKMGLAIVMLAGDFRQTLPIVTRGIQQNRSMPV
ncbi:ATP-dependent DNA helicase [Trichonephila clavipes]|nr:ATP-dependent DNA helicase [Trichonephila clavipes]